MVEVVTSSRCLLALYTKLRTGSCLTHVGREGTVREGLAVNYTVLPICAQEEAVRADPLRAVKDPARIEHAQLETTFPFLSDLGSRHLRL